MKLAILSTAVAAALTLASTPACTEPLIVLTPASAAPAAPLESRCMVGPERAGGSEVECIVLQRTAARAAPAPAMRIVIHTQTASAACRPRNAQEIALPGPGDAPAGSGALPQVVQDRRERVCAF
jgi:hypothetical protein